MYIESEILELKEKYTDNLNRDIVAFLNTNGGKLYIDINDNSEVIGIPISKLDEIPKNLFDCITSQIEPNPQMDIKTEIIDEESKAIILLTISKGFKPLYCIKKYGFSSKGCLIRIGTTCKEMTLEK